MQTCWDGSVVRVGEACAPRPIPTVSQPVIQEVDPRELGIPDTPYSASYTATSQGWGQYDATRYPSAQYSSLNQEQSLESTEQAALAPDALAPCEALRNVVTVRECERFTAIKRMAEDGNATLAAPESMDAGQSYDVFVIVGTKEQRASIEETAASVGTFQTGEIKLAPYVCAELSAEGFTANPTLSDGPQCTERGAAPEMTFKWQVSPKVNRALTLKAQVTTYVSEGGQNLGAVGTNTVSVNVNASTWWRFDQAVNRMTGSLMGLREALLALLAVLAVVSAIIWRLKNMGAKPEKGDLDAPAT